MGTRATVGRRILGNTAAIIGSNVLRRMLGFVASVSVARYLPVETFGRYVLVLATMELFRSVADFGIDYIVVRRLASGEGRDLVWPALKLKLATATAAIGCAQVFALALGYGPQFMGYLALASLALLFNTISSTLQTLFQATLSMRRLVPVNGVAGVLLVALVWVGIVMHVSVAGLLAATVLAEAYALMMTSVLVRRSRRRDEHGSSAVVSLQSLLIDAAPLGLGSILIMVYFRLDTIVLAKTAGEAAVGSYGAVFRITEGIVALAAGLTATFLPVLSACFAHAGSRDRARVLYERGFKLLVGGAVLAASAMTILAGPVMRLLYGVRYEDAAPALAVLVWSTVFMSVNMLQASAFVALNRQRALFGVIVLVLLINVTLVFTLIPRFGVMGACVATVATEGANTLIQNVVLARDLPVGRLLATGLGYSGLALLAVGWHLALGDSLPLRMALGAALAFYGVVFLARQARSLTAERDVRQLLLRVTAGGG